MKVKASKLPDGKFELFLEIPPIKLPVTYSIYDLELLEEAGVICHRDSYNASSLLKFTLSKKGQENVETAILNAVTEKAVF